MPRDIHDAPGPLPGEVLTPPPADDDTDPRVLSAMRAHPGLDWSRAYYSDVLDAVVIPRAELERVETCLRWEVWRVNYFPYVVAVFASPAVSLAACEPAPMFEGAYIASPTPRAGRVS
jgi:hypothetical protein